MGTHLIYRERIGQLLPKGAIDSTRDLSLVKAGADGCWFVVFKPDLLADLDEFKQRLGELISRIEATQRQSAAIEIRIPGERVFGSCETELRAGIEVDRLVYETLASGMSPGSG